jgi:hypothetical protein
MPYEWTDLDLLRICTQQGYRVVGEQRTAIANDMPEKTLLGNVRRLAKTYGWILYHTHDSRHSEDGFPDVVLARSGTATSPGRLIFAELKTAKKKPTQAQETWLSILAHTLPDVEVYVWRPADVPTIVEILSARLGKSLMTT